MGSSPGLHLARLRSQVLFLELHLALGGTLNPHGHARSLSQVENPPRNATTFCLCWFHQTCPVGTRAPGPVCCWARSSKTTSNVPAVSSSLLFVLSCVCRLRHFSSQRRRQQHRQGNHLKCDKLKGKPTGMNKHQSGGIRSPIQSTPVADQRSVLNKSAAFKQQPCLFFPQR